jgi:glutathione synthase/RimK-type ligase-like ATP-grasp enzyme
VNRPVLIWGLPEDPPTRAVHAWLVAHGAEVVLLDHAAVADTHADFGTCPDFVHRVSHNGRWWRLENFSAAYLRPYDARAFELAPAPLARATLVHHLICDWAEYADTTIVNRPSAEATNHSKLRQAIEIRASGFLTPESLVTNEPRRILGLQSRYGSVVYKSLSSVRSVVKELSASDLPRTPIGPVLVQQRIRGVNMRVHVVGHRTFACRVESDGVDYRYSRSTLVDVDLDDDVARRCVALTRRLGLLVSGIDLIATAAGEWYCLEVNPNPGFTAFDPSGREDVAKAVAELLLEQPPIRVPSRS